MRIAICEDENAQILLLKKQIAEWSVKSKIAVNVFSYNSAESFLFSIEDEEPFDILLLDIQMSEMTGVEMAKKLRQQKNDVIIIFITALKEFILEGYNVDALHYIIKPVEKNKLFECLDKAVTKLNKSESYIILNMTRINQKDISFVEAREHYVEIHTVDDVLKIKKSMKAIYSELDSNMFYLCHRSYIINISFIKKFLKEEMILEDDTKIPISRSKYKEIRKTFINYYTDR